MKWKIWLDDIRESPQDYIWCRSVNECKKQIELCEALEGVELLDIDHDLGEYSSDGGDGIALIDWLAKRDTMYPIALHTQNPVGRNNMLRAIESYYRHKNKREEQVMPFDSIDENPKTRVYYKGIFWIVDENHLENNNDYIFRIPVDCNGNLLDIDLFYPLNSKSGRDYNHRLTWLTYVKKELQKGKEYNYFPRGRVEIRNSTATIFLNPDIATKGILEYLSAQFALADLSIKVVCDGSKHYRSFLDFDT